MERDLSIFDNSKVFKKVSRGKVSRKIVFVKLHGEIIILKIFRKKNKEKYINEKRIYLRLKDEDFLPKLRYFDDENLILGLTYVGDSLEIFRTKKKEEYNRQVDNINKQIKSIVDSLLSKYGLYHNDLRYRNICIDEFNKIRLIDFDWTNDKLLERERRYHLSQGGDEMYFKCYQNKM